MVKYEFEQTQKHLENTMTKQAGSIEKALLEATMNSADAGASKLNIMIHSEETVVTDDGKGMTKEEIETNFKYFGLEGDDQDEKTYGKFRMGRGQIFNFGITTWRTKNYVIVVDIHNDRTEVEKTFNFDKSDDAILEVHDDTVVLDSEGLGFHLFEADNEVEGTEIRIKHRVPFDNTGSVRTKFADLAKFIPMVTEMEIKVNGDLIGETFEPTLETQTAYYLTEPDAYSNRVTIYNQGAKVKTEYLNKCGGTIVTKKDLDVNFARNDILNHCDVYETVKHEWDELTFETLIEHDNPSKLQANWLIEYAKEHPERVTQVKEKPMIRDINGNLRSMNEISGKTISFAKQGDAMGKRVMQESSTIMLDEEHKQTIIGSESESNTRSYSEVVSEEIAYGSHRVNTNDLSKRRHDNYQKLNHALDKFKQTPAGYHFRDTILEVGVSDAVDVWREEDGSVVVDRGALNCSKDDLRIDLLFDLARVIVAEGDSRKGITEDYDYNERFTSLMAQYPAIQRSLL